MKNNIPMSYDDEPEDVFLPMSDQLYQELYDIEMEGFADDLDFYIKNLSGKESVLELGCGSGRISRRLAKYGYLVTGCDISMTMLNRARQLSLGEKYVCMDIGLLAFQTDFDAIIIPYNTLNLLNCQHHIHSCFERCRSICHPKSNLLFQIFTPTSDLLNLQESEKTFQFQIFDRPGGGKIIKETLKQYHKSSCILEMKEQYRIRPMTKQIDNENYLNTYQLYVPELQYWLDTLRSNGFEAQSIHNEYRQGAMTSNGTYLINATPL